jgi:hypothetical protein
MRHNISQLEAEADAVGLDRLAPRSRDAYRSSSIRFLSWMYECKRELLPPTFQTALIIGSDGVPTQESIQQALASKIAPLHFEQITAKDFMTWIMALKDDDGLYFKFTTYGTHRSAFASLYGEFNVIMPLDMKQGIANRFSGLKKRIARQISNGYGEIKEGKDPLPFSLFRRIALEMMHGTARDLIFARTFMLLSWNLMSRAANTVSICYSHLEWGEDALRVYFAHMKNDQGGSKPRDPRHVYANPLAPEICPILALGTCVIQI